MRGEGEGEGEGVAKAPYWVDADNKHAGKHQQALTFYVCPDGITDCANDTSLVHTVFRASRGPNDTMNITLIDPSAVDHEARDHWDLTVVVEDDEFSSRGPVRVVIRDIN